MQNSDSSTFNGGVKYRWRMNKLRFSINVALSGKRYQMDHSVGQKLTKKLLIKRPYLTQHKIDWAGGGADRAVQGSVSPAPAITW